MSPNHSDLKLGLDFPGQKLLSGLRHVAQPLSFETGFRISRAEVVEWIKVCRLTTLSLDWVLIPKR